MSHARLLPVLTWRLELFTHTVPVPFAVYFSAVTGSLYSLEEYLSMGVAATIAATAMLLGAFYLRYIRLKKASYLEDRSSIDPNLLSSAKSIYITQPIYESFVIVGRWFFGVLLAHLIVYLIVGYRPNLIATIPALYLGIIPISFISYLFITEYSVRPALSRNKFREVEAKTRLFFPYSKRLLVVVMAMISMPFSLLGYMLYATVDGRIRLENPLLHLAIMALLFSVPLIFTAWIVTEAIRSRLSSVTGFLEEVGEGNFGLKISPSSLDEFGKQEQRIGKVVERLRGLYEEIQSLNEGLESKVEERTKQLKETADELGKSLDEIHKLKLSQDGDYFLTSLLTEPLHSIQLQDSEYSFRSLTVQKKKFNYKQKERQIGGDISLAHSIRLRGKPYIAFVNADAMGKSLQGAVGAIILGSISRSMIERTPALYRNVWPERWLKNWFIELQKVFEAFDGSLMASGFLGLLDESRGVLYYINCEHPSPVLYRDETTMFLEPKEKYFKIGHSGIGRNVHIEVFQLRSGDVLFSGSDGRDDLLIKSEIDPDDSRFLEIVGRAKGDLDLTYELILQEGEITDDLSLLRIEAPKKSLTSSEILLKESDPEKKNGNQKTVSLQECRRLALEYSSGKKYAKAGELGLKYVQRRPTDTEFLFTVSKLLRKSGKIVLSIDLGERYRMRNPVDSDNLLHLAEMYASKSRLERSFQLLAEATAISPEHPRAKKLSEFLIEKTAQISESSEDRRILR
ncbi:SpoIIE family protein phosphatase [Leptospira venezuelensis]|uniref:SpoIIE family protein phosphatase n=1 Tax=Leptospira venezuelensis TaxID=1958811 RepID=UPI000A3824C6|nr:SpoIIE family protein phosphatase [Leptospira venezuelensis]